MSKTETETRATSGFIVNVACGGNYNGLFQVWNADGNEISDEEEKRLLALFGTSRELLEALRALHEKNYGSLGFDGSGSVWLMLCASAIWGIGGLSAAGSQVLLNSATDRAHFFDPALNIFDRDFLFSEGFDQFELSNENHVKVDLGKVRHSFFSTADSHCSCKQHA